MRKPIFVLFLISSGLAAQDTVAPASDETVGPVAGENKGDYNIVQSWEFGGRFASVGGNEGKYRGDVNYRSGVSLLSSSLTVNSKDGHGHWFDEIMLSTQGLGSDPYQSATLRIARNKWYRYDLLWRQNAYYNPGLTVSAGEHLEDTTHRWQDHELTLFPESHFRVRAGYSRVTQSGPALTTAQEFDSRSDVYPIFRNVLQQFDDYRLAADGVWNGFKFTVQKRWEYFKEDTKDNQTIAEPGTSPAGLTSFVRPQPYRGRAPGWMGNIYGERKWIALNGRITYTGGKGDFVQNETAIGLDRFGAAANRQIIVTGSGDRPVFTGSFNTTVFPASRFSVINSVSISNTRMNGSNFYQQFDQSTFTLSTINFQMLAIRLVTNATDARFRVSKKFDLFAGFRYSDRLIRSIEDSASPGTPYEGVTAQQTNHTKSGVAGFNWLPVKNVRLHLEGEVGRNDNPFTPVSMRNYHAIRSKVQYRTKAVSYGGGYQENYNNNSIDVTAYSSHARTYSGEASWSAKSWVSLDGSYSKMHLDTVGGIVFFSGAPRAVQVKGTESIYVSNIHAANVGLRFALRRYADLYVGYNLTRDNGDGRGIATGPTAPATAVAGVFTAVQTFPLTYQTPLLRLSVRISQKLRYNIGYQYYGYKEEFGVEGVNQNYRANTGYTSLLWAF